MYGLNHGWGMSLVWIFGIIILVLIVWLLFRAINQKQDRTEGKSAFHILKERFARGEISKEEFEEKKKGIS